MSLSPIGRKLIVESLCLSKLSQIAMCVPSLSDRKIKQLENMLFRFVWASNRNKVAAIDAKCSEIVGGMNMFCIKSSWSGYKTKWLNKCVNNPDSIYARIVMDEVKNTIPRLSWERLSTITMTELKGLGNKFKLLFWREVFKKLHEGLLLHVKQERYTILMINFWDNLWFKIGNNKLTINNEYIKRNLCYPYQFIASKEGQTITFLTGNEIEQRYNIRINQQTLLRIQLGLKNGLNRFGFRGEHLPDNEMVRPAIDNYVNFQKKGCRKWVRTFKNNLLNTSNIRLREIKWETRLNFNQGRINWNGLYKLNIGIKFDNNVKFFHKLLLRDSLQTKSKTSNYREENDICGFCNNARETNYHLFWECQVVANLRLNAKNALNAHYAIDNEIFTDFRYFGFGQKFECADTWGFLFCIDFLKYIWYGKFLEYNINLVAFKRYLNRFLVIQKGAKILKSVSNMNVNQLWL